MTLTYGELFAGYGGLGLGVQSVLGGEMTWCAEFDKAPSKILAHHWPDVPNLGDVTKVDWSTVPPVDVITGGSPCQDLSHAGKRAGMKAGTRSGLWASMCDAIDIIRPRLVVWENVRGALSAEATAGDVESCEFCVGGDGEPHLRALGRVLGDLAELGYDAWWYGLRAADVGAAHGRFRIFVYATPADAGSEAWKQRSGLRTDDPARGGRGLATRGSGEAGGEPLTRLPPTPRTTDGTKGGPNQRGASGDLMLPSAVLLPTPSAADGLGGHERRGGARGNELLLNGVAKAAQREPQTFGTYAPAIARWESAISRPAPSPTEPTGKGGAHRLSPRFVEWLMGLPDGHVTRVDISRNDQLKALGNGVVPQQAAAAAWAFLSDYTEATA